MSDTEKTWKLQELADEAGVSPRTVRYYVQRGLLPAPAFRGKDTAYSEAHLLRLRAIRRLQEAYLPLDAIQAELEGRGLDEVRKLAGGEGMALRGAVESVGSSPPPLAGKTDVDTTSSLSGMPDVSPPGAVSGEAGEGRWVRWTVAAGLELHLSDDADEATRTLAEELKNYVARRKNA